MCCYDKILVNVAKYVTSVYCLICTAHTHTHTHLTRNYIFGHIYQYFIITTHYHIVFYHFNNSKL
jgi:hypothetical protein